MAVDAIGSPRRLLRELSNGCTVATLIETETDQLKLMTYENSRFLIFSDQHDLQGSECGVQAVESCNMAPAPRDQHQEQNAGLASGVDGVEGGMSFLPACDINFVQ